MKPTTTQHPSAETLHKFGLGQLDAADSSAIERHVEHCEACCTVLRDVGDDTLLVKLKNSDTSIGETVAWRGAKPLDAAATSQAIVDHPRYEVVRQLGAGGMGVVYLARHRMMDRLVAIKVINPRLVKHSTAVDRFRLEVKAAAKLTHPNIVAAFDAEQVGDWHLLAMEFVDGVTLAKQVAKGGPLSIRHACHFIRQAALGLQHASDKGMVHRDIKPQNLMLTRDAKVKILDFGLARFAQDVENESAAKLTTDGVTLGTPDYMAPEQIVDPRRADVRADIYSLGCTMYFLLTGQPPFPDGSPVDKLAAHMKQKPRALSTLRRDVPAELNAVVERMMAKRPEQRPASPAEVAELLAPFCRSAPEPVAIVAPPAQPLDGLPAFGFMALPPTPVVPLRQFNARIWLQRNQRSLATTVGVLLFAIGIVAAAPLFRSLFGSAQGFVKQALPSKSSANSGETKRDFGETKSSANSAFPVATTSLPDASTSPISPRVLIVVPFRNLYWPDYVKVRQVLDRTAVRIEVASSQVGTAIAHNRGQILIERTLADCDPASYDAVVFTGAYPTSDLEFQYDAEPRAAAHRIVNGLQSRGKVVSAICGGVSVLADGGFLDGQPAAWNQFLPPEIQNRSAVHWRKDTPTQSAGNVITARSPDDANPFTNELLRRLRLPVPN